MASALLGLLAGLVWSALAPRALLVVQSRGVAYVVNPETSAFIVADAWFCLLTALGGPRHDYVAFLEMWQMVRGGYDPWWITKRLGYPLNAYGPLFNLLAPLAGWNPLAPKLLMPARRGFPGGDDHSAATR